VGEPRPNDRVRLLVVGDAGVGKSSFVHLVCHGAVLRSATATVGCGVDAKLHGHAGVSYYVEFVEIGGAEKWRVARSVFFMQRFDGVVMLHDLTNRNSRANLDRWRRELAESRPDDSRASAADADDADADDPYASVAHAEDRRIDDASGSPLKRTASAGASLNRRQSAMPGPAEEEWVHAGEMVRARRPADRPTDAAARARRVRARGAALTRGSRARRSSSARASPRRRAGSRASRSAPSSTCSRRERQRANSSRRA
jgi:hypothetical protein